MSIKLRKKVYFVGPHSTGKTTLVNALQKHYDSDTIFIKETARKVLRAKGYCAADIESPRCLSMQRDILLSQFKAERKLIRKHGEQVAYISDRAGVDAILYAKKYAPGVDEWKELCDMEEWRYLAEKYRDTTQSLVVLVTPTKSFLTNDGTRKMPLDWNEWVEFGELFVDFLESQNIPFKQIGKTCPDLNDRVAKVMAWIGDNPK